MNPVHLIQSLIQTESLLKSPAVNLKPGQLLYGRVVKLLPDDTALIQIGNERLFASVKATLSTEDRYWFEVRSNGGEGTELKVVEGKGQSASADFLLKHFRLPETKQNLQLLEFLLSENVAFTKEQLKTAATWISSAPEIKELTALAWMIKKELPFTTEIFKALVAVQDSKSFSQQLEQVNRDLANPKFSALKSIQSLKELISTILGNHSSDDLSTGAKVKQMMQTMQQSLGLDYEKEVQLWSKGMKNSLETSQSLKSLVLEAMMELGGSGKVLEPLLNRLTGMQLISQDLTGAIQQVVMQLPLSIEDRHKDITVQWNGRKTSNGQLDPHYCRILFYLELESLNQTVIDMNVQNAMIHVSVINDTEGIESIITAFTPTLKEKLESIGYKLSSIEVVHSSIKGQMNPNLLSDKFFRRLDIKV